MNEIAAPLNIAVIGAGLIGERHARLINQLTAFRLCAIVDPSEASKALAAELKVVSFLNLDDFFESEMSCDGVVIATPNETHRPFSLECIQHGLPCLIEKPLASNSKDAAAIHEASTHSGVPILVGHHRRHHTVSRILKEKIDNGDLGQLVGAQLSWMLRKPDDYFEAGEWRIQKGGGPIWINLIHEIDLIRYFMGEIIEVSAMISNSIRGNNVEDTAIINMRCENGALVSAILSDTAPSPWHFEGGSGENPNISETGHGGLRLFGTKASIEFPSLKQWQHSDIKGHWGEPIGCKTYTTPNNLGGETALTAQLENFSKVIRGISVPLVTAQDGVQSVRVVEAIHQSAVDGKTIIVKVS